MILVVALSTPASALAAVDTGLYCGDTSARPLPAHGATDVPTDIAPFLVWGCSPWDFPVTVTLTGPDSPVPIHQGEYELRDFLVTEGDLTLEPTWDMLAPDTTYTLVVAAGGQGPQTVRFTTGSGPAVPAEGLPTLRTEYAGQDDRRGNHPLEVELRVDGVSGPFATWLVEEDGRARARLYEAGRTSAHAWPGERRQREVCLTVKERDSRGVWRGPSDPSCVSVTRRRGCAHTQPVLGGALLLPLLLAVRRRR
ncbi:MAG: hypothetical protein H6737_12645 [Alphaproteobacteria bacterium]|nr:hypothetical protein [Alphaproteobacteria bacterium]